MIRFSQCGHLVYSGLFLILTACTAERDPANETAIELEPGLYEVTVTAGVISTAGKKEEAVSVCLRESDRVSFPYRLAEDYLIVHGGCRAHRLAREGNWIAGEVICAADAKFADGTSRFVYNGAVARDNVKLEAKIKFDAVIKDGAGGAEVSKTQMKLAMKVMERVRSVIEAKRTGNCD